MKRLLTRLSLVLFFPILCFAQQQGPNTQGSIAASGSTCATAYACVWQSVLPNNAATTTINLSGTFSATLLVEESNNGGQSWTTAATLTTAGTTTYSTNGFTDIRVRCSAYTSGTAIVTISTGLNTGLQGPPGPPGSSSGGGGAVAPNQVNFYASPNCSGQTNCTTLSTTADNATNFSTLFALSNASTTTTNPVDPRTAPQAAEGHSVTSQVVSVTNYPGDTIFVLVQDNNLLGATPISDGLNTYSNVIPATTLGSAGTLSLWKATGTLVIDSLTVTATGSDNLVVSVLVLPGVSGQVVGTTSSSASSNTVSIAQTTTQAGSMVIAGCAWYNGGAATLTSTAGTLRLNQAGTASLAGQGLWGTYQATIGTVTNSGTLSGAASATGCISAEIKGGGTTQGNPVIDVARGYYYYSANFNPTIPTTIRCEPGTFLHYIGTNDYMDFGPIGGLAAGQGVIFPPYILQGCSLAGGNLMAKGIVLQPNIAAVQILDNNFLDSGSATQPIIWGTCENWDILVSRNRFISDDFTGRPVFSNNNGPFNSGNCPAATDENSFVRLLDNVGYIMPGRGQSASSSGADVSKSAVGFIIDTAHFVISGNNLAFYNPVFKLRCSAPNFNSTGAGCAGGNITSNLLEPPSSGTTNRVPVIQYSTGVDELQVEHNEVFLANLAGDALLGPISGSDVLTNARIITNQVGRVPSGSPLVVLNNLAGNTGNQAAGNGCSIGSNIGPNTSGGCLLHTAGGNIPQWTFNPDESLEAVGLQPVITGTGACATFTASSQKGSWAGRIGCSGTTGASTLTITPGGTAPNGWACSGSDMTTAAIGIQTGVPSTTACTLTFANVTSADIISFSVIAN